MTKLFLLRHAEAENTAPDALRILTKVGRRSAIDLAQFIDSRIRLNIDEIWHSPLIRAVETASLFKEAAELPAPMKEVACLHPMDEPKIVIHLIEKSQKNVLLVGHNPHFEALTAELLGLDPARVPVNVPKASLLRFKRSGGDWQMRDLLTTKVTGRQ